MAPRSTERPEHAIQTDPYLLHRLASEHHRQLLEAGDQARQAKEARTAGEVGDAGNPSRRPRRLGLGWLRRRPAPVTLRPVARS
ncbi:MAG: hypothetical protein ACRD0A_04590 [Acidimicrobiales bacterium]